MKKAMVKAKLATAVLIVVIIGFACNKNNDPANPAVFKLSYGDSILYLKNQSSDYIVSPVEARAGTYTAFPDGIEINENTGAINVSKSETGLRYRITYTSPLGETSTTIVVLSGITFLDKFYNLAQNDSIAFPVYNASVARVLPVAGSVFDEGNNANSGGCSVKTLNGQINLAETVRNGVFGSTPQNDVRRDFDIFYRLNDASDKSLNKLRVRVYYYNSMSDVAPDLLQTLNDRASDGVFIGMGRTTGLAKPRPPCVIIVGH